ncbi:hypothetical protein GCM10007874_22110 [Labrys miyagiensis]|uniref:Uncharacterized protein n=1 Tax=Labrys miyagiensis TaxID=346912 RepID=A0ABQ6CG44_9HYPH|nr:hypothetical protein [Labrys miyagiensis]GLS19194.1 hypothetical protein GCM10007874_22110 [Labrys miyagiensis]
MDVKCRFKRIGRTVLVMAVAYTPNTVSAASLGLACREFCGFDQKLERPDPPYCAKSFRSFADQYEFDSCKNEVLAYQSKMHDYQTCLVEESKDASDELNETINSFNSRARSPWPVLRFVIGFRDWRPDCGRDHPEDGCLWVYGLDDQQIPACTDFGLESLTDFIREHKGNRGSGQAGSPQEPGS